MRRHDQRIRVLVRIVPYRSNLNPFCYFMGLGIDLFVHCQSRISKVKIHEHCIHLAYFSTY